VVGGQRLTPPGGIAARGGHAGTPWRRARLVPGLPPGPASALLDGSLLLPCPLRLARAGPSLATLSAIIACDRGAGDSHADGQRSALGEVGTTMGRGVRACAGARACPGSGPFPSMKEPYQAVIWALCEQMGCQKGVGERPRDCTKACGHFLPPALLCVTCPHHCHGGGRRVNTLTKPRPDTRPAPRSG